MMLANAVSPCSMQLLESPQGEQTEQPITDPNQSDQEITDPNQGDQVITVP